MNYTILLDASAGLIRAALLDQNERLCELCVEPQKKDQDYDTVVAGAIYKARVVSVVPSLDAAFVDLGTGVSGILHGFSLPASFTKSKIRQPLAGILRENSEIMVEIKRPGYAAKGPKVSADIGLNGRYMVLLPYTGKTFTSQKLPPKERRRLEEDSKKLSPRGKILRTGAAAANFAELEAEELALINRWREIEAIAAKTPAPCVLYTPDVIMQAVENWLNRFEIAEIICNNKAIAQKIKDCRPEVKFNVKACEPKWDLFAEHNVETQIEQALNRRVVLPSGISLVIEPTESMTVIDVNSGKFAGENFEETALKVNMEAAREIARELKLRCIGGLVVIDFIDMHREENRAKVTETLRTAFKNDANTVDVAGFTQSGVLTLKRSRTQRPWQVMFTKSCTGCHAGLMLNARYYAHKIFREVVELKDDKQPLTLTMHPEVAAFFNEAGQPLLMEMQYALQTTICVKADNDLAYADYHIVQTPSNT